MHTRTVEARVLFQCPPIKRNIFLFAFSRANTLTDLHSFNYTYMYSMPHSYIKYIQTYIPFIGFITGSVMSDITDINNTYIHIKFMFTCIHTTYSRARS